MFIVVMLCSLFSLHACYWDQECYDDKAIILKPFVDVTARYFEIDATSIYDNLSYSWCDKPEHCPRARQLLFNEVVKILEVKNGQVHFAVSNLIYEDEGKQTNEFWTLESNLVKLRDLNKELLKSVPQPLTSFDLNFNKKINNNELVTLCFPWVDPETKMSFSAGTRFVIQSKLNNGFIIQYIDYKAAQVRNAFIEKEHVYYEQYDDSKLKKGSLLAILNKWIKPNVKIPYVWGGCSYINEFEPDNRQKLVTKTKDGEFASWMRPGVGPFSGVDCSGLLLRLFQMFGFSFFYQNTAIISKYLYELKEGDSISETDFLWIPGHIMMVNNINDNTIIEARGYGAGYGYVHIIQLSKTFQGITNFSELFDCCLKGKPLAYLNGEGQVSKHCNCKVLRFKEQSV